MRDTLRDTLRETLFSDFARTLLIISSQIKKNPNLAVLQKKILENKYSNLNFSNCTDRTTSPKIYSDIADFFS